MESVLTYGLTSEATSPIDTVQFVLHSPGGQFPSVLCAIALMRSGRDQQRRNSHQPVLTIGLVEHPFLHISIWKRRVQWAFGFYLLLRVDQLITS